MLAIDIGVPCRGRNLRRNLVEGAAHGLDPSQGTSRPQPPRQRPASVDRTGSDAPPRSGSIQAGPDRSPRSRPTHALRFATGQVARRQGQAGGPLIAGSRRHGRKPSRIAAAGLRAHVDASSGSRRLPRPGTGILVGIRITGAGQRFRPACAGGSRNPAGACGIFTGDQPGKDHTHGHQGSRLGRNTGPAREASPAARFVPTDVGATGRARRRANRVPALPGRRGDLGRNPDRPVRGPDSCGARVGSSSTVP